MSNCETAVPFWLGGQFRSRKEAPLPISSKEFVLALDELGFRSAFSLTSVKGGYLFLGKIAGRRRICLDHPFRNQYLAWAFLVIVSNLYHPCAVYINLDFRERQDDGALVEPFLPELQSKLTQGFKFAVFIDLFIYVPVGELPSNPYYTLANPRFGDIGL